MTSSVDVWRLWSRGVRLLLMGLVVVNTLQLAEGSTAVAAATTTTNNIECFRKFSAERKACKGRMRHHVTSSNDVIASCCARRGQGYSTELFKSNRSQRRASNWFECIPCTDKSINGTNYQQHASAGQNSVSRDHMSQLLVSQSAADSRELLHSTANGAVLSPATNIQRSTSLLLVDTSDESDSDSTDQLLTADPQQTYFTLPWSSWTDWTACTATCGGSPGFQQRTRFCRRVIHCQGHNFEQRPCVPELLQCPVNGGWTAWTDWQSCSVSCGNYGIQIRSRSCTNPAAFGGGSDCGGPETEVRNCSMASVQCPVDGAWSSWTQWSDCSASCGPAERLRYRNCDSPQPSNGGRECEGGPSVESQPCASLPCPLDGGWSDWSNWTACSAACGEGFQTRSRNCENPRPEHGGRPCEGLELESTPCVTRTNCPVDGGWSDWSRLDVCSAAPCSGLPGRRTRFRSCSNPRPMFGGLACRGRTWSVEPCYNNEFCTASVNGGWCAWSDWTACAPGDDVTRRYRNCQCPPPVNGGANCIEGNEVEEMECKKKEASDLLSNVLTSSPAATAAAVDQISGCEFTDEGSAAGNSGSDDECSDPSSPDSSMHLETIGEYGLTV